MNGKYYCPKFSDIRLISCFTPPTKEVLIGKLKSVSEKNNWSLGFSDESRPDKSWILMLLSTYCDKNEIFNKSYVAPPIKNKKKEEKTIKVPKSLFEGLPAKKSGKRVRRMKLELVKDARNKQKDIR
jgi:hypothetical protein